MRQIIDAEHLLPRIVHRALMHQHKNAAAVVANARRDNAVLRQLVGQQRDSTRIQVGLGADDDVAHHPQACEAPACGDDAAADPQSTPQRGHAQSKRPSAIATGPRPHERSDTRAPLPLVVHHILS